ncbi:TRAP transporter small permease subunit [Azospirillum halopraeferens]|uniref:TRAP transporter small permease subunit n=1 Tax=Azospirillum halopraeferens TaxID=34010 RepID=UPI000412C8D4|nr:TRAP transporter small permease subunit [Azospirillum halopraeferens]
MHRSRFATKAADLAALGRCADALDRVVDVCGRLAAWSALALVLVMAGNVLLRYGLRTGSVAMQELEWHLMSPLALLCIAYAVKHDGHVRVDVLYNRFGLRTRQVIELVSCLLALALCVIVVKLSIPYALQSYAIGERSSDPGGLTHRYILKAMIPAGFALLGLHSLASVLRAAIPLAQPRPEADLVRVDRGEGHRHAAE